MQNICIQFSFRTVATLARALSTTRVASQLRFQPLPSSIAIVRGITTSGKMSDSDSENFDVDNVSDDSESDGYEVPVKKVNLSGRRVFCHCSRVNVTLERYCCSFQAKSDQGPSET